MRKQIVFPVLVCLCFGLFYACSGSSSSNGPDERQMVESSSSKTLEDSSDTKNTGAESSSAGDIDDVASSSSEKSSSSRPTDVVEPEISVVENCVEVGACDAMVKTDVSTWHFVCRDAFGDDAEYVYKTDGKDLIVTIKHADGSTDSKTYSMYDMESEIGVEMAFSAAKATCRDGKGNYNTIKTCEMDTIVALPECDKKLENYLGKEDSYYVICKSGSWVDASVLEYDTYGLECFDDGRIVKGNVIDSNKYVCDMGIFRLANETEIEFYNDTTGLLCEENGRLVNGNVNVKNQYVCESGKFRLATYIEMETNGLDCVEGKIVTGIVTNQKHYVCKLGKFQEALPIEVAMNSACTDKNEGQMGRGDNQCFYYCVNQSWECMRGWNLNLPKRAMMNRSITYDSIVDARDNQVYRTVKIGEQVWMAENLNYSDSAKTPSLLGRSWCYRDSLEYCDRMGRIYTYSAAIDSMKLLNDKDNPQDCGYEKRCKFTTQVQGLCPNGWHLPSETEWDKLFLTAESDEESDGTTDLSSVAGWENGKEGLDVYGFSAYPVGTYKSRIDQITINSSSANFWVAGVDYVISISAGNGGRLSSYYKKNDGISIRCIKD